MQILIIKNKIQLVEPNDRVKLSLIVPARNLQAMKEITQCRILSKEPFTAKNRHYAGQLFNVSIRVEFCKIRQYLLSTEELKFSDNWNELKGLLVNPEVFFFVKKDRTPLYAFGNCYQHNDYVSCNVIYYAPGKPRVSFTHSALNHDGKKRYIRFKGTWYSNRNF